MTKNCAIYYLTYNQIGSLRLVADASGNVVKELKYDTFGNIIGDSNPTFTIPFGFACGLHDRDTGLVRFGHRDYDPETGRWTAKDPIGFAGGDTDLYGYCLNNPVNGVDPEGLFISAATITAIGVGLAAAGFVTFFDQAFKNVKKGNEASDLRDKLLDEIEKNIPDPEYAEKLSRAVGEEKMNFLKDLRDTLKKGTSCAIVN